MLPTTADSRSKCQDYSHSATDVRTAITKYEGSTAADQPTTSAHDELDIGLDGAGQRKG